jgi:hypothetical protein
MKLIKILSAFGCAVALLATPAMAREKTCCEKAAAAGKDCTHKCCVAAHKDHKSCEKCNPNKEDLKLKKKQDKKTNKTPEKSPEKAS